MSVATQSLPQNRAAAQTPRPIPDFIAERIHKEREADLSDAIAHAVAGNRQPLWDLANKVEDAVRAKVKKHLARADYRLYFCPHSGEPCGVVKQDSDTPCLVGTFTPVSMLAGEGPAESVCFCEHADYIWRLNGALMWAGFARRIECKHPKLFRALLRRWQEENGKVRVGRLPSPRAFSWMQEGAVA
jgi:hypothetical protein